MFKYKIEIVPIKDGGTGHLGTDKRQMLVALLGMLTVALKAMPEVISADVDDSHALIVVANSDISSTLKSFGNNVMVSQL